MSRPMTANPLDQVIEEMLGRCESSDKAGLGNVSTPLIREWANTLASLRPAAGANGTYTRDREADRKQFSDEAFNRWLDQGVSDCGHTVWDMVPDVACAWQGWEGRQWYMRPAAGGEAVLSAVGVEVLALLRDGLARDSLLYRDSEPQTSGAYQLCSQRIAEILDMHTHPAPAAREAVPEALFSARELMRELVSSLSMRGSTITVHYDDLRSIGERAACLLAASPPPQSSDKANMREVHLNGLRGKMPDGSAPQAKPQEGEVWWREPSPGTRFLSDVDVRFDGINTLGWERVVKVAKEQALACDGCGKPYRDLPLDVVLPDDQWLTIHGSPGGVLCAACIVARGAKVPGVTVAKLHFPDLTPPTDAGTGDRDG